MKTLIVLVISLILIRPCGAALLDPDFQLGFGPGKPWNITPEGLTSIQSGLSTVDDLQGRYAKIDLGWTRPLGYHGSGAYLSQRFFANTGDTLRLWYKIQSPEISVPPSPFSLFANLLIRQQDDHGTYGPPVDIFKYTSPTTALNLGWTEYEFTFPANAAYLLQFGVLMGAAPEALDTDTFSASSALRFTNPIPEPSAIVALLATMAILGIGFHRRLFGTTTRMSLSAILGVLLIATSTQAQTVSFGSGLNQFNMEFVEIGSPGNAADTTGVPNPAGAVGYTYQMGKFEVSEDMIDKANALGGLAITKDTRGPTKPATSINWNEAARFVNWLNTNQGFPQAYKFSTQPGDGDYNANESFQFWSIGDQGFDADNFVRNKLSNYFLPSIDEWYKAAYYDPNLNTYFDYPNGSNTLPTAVPSGTAAGTAVWNGQAGPADIMQAGGLSPFGVMGLSGNAIEWLETPQRLSLDGPFLRPFRGGYWGDTSFSTSKNTIIFNFNQPTTEGFGLGFRVMSLAPVPEPSTWALIVTLTMGLFAWGVKAKRMQSGQSSPSLG